jgi:hypothetical protein
MSFIDLPMNIDEVKEDQPVPEGEYNLVISDVKEKNNEDGSLKSLLVICEIQGQEGAANVLHNISMPQPADDPEKISFKMKFIKRFVQLFKVKTDGGKLNLSAFPGCTAKCFLTQEEYNGTVSNKIKLPAAK